MKHYLPSKLRLTKDKDKFECYLRGMANALYIYAALNKIEDITWDICYEIAWETIFIMNWQYIDVDNYLEGVEHYNKIQPQYKHDIFSILTGNDLLGKFKYRAENKRSLYYDKLTSRDKISIQNKLIEEYTPSSWKPIDKTDEPIDETEDYINSLLEDNNNER